MSQQRTLDDVWREARPQIDLLYPGYDWAFDTLRPVAWDGVTLTMGSDQESVVRLFQHPRWWKQVGDIIGFCIGLRARVPVTYVLISADKHISRG